MKDYIIEEKRLSHFFAVSLNSVYEGYVHPVCVELYLTKLVNYWNFPILTLSVCANLQVVSENSKSLIIAALVCKCYTI